jgi:hypothetical protein
MPRYSSCAHDSTAAKGMNSSDTTLQRGKSVPVFFVKHRSRTHQKLFQMDVAERDKIYNLYHANFWYEELFKIIYF